MSRKMKKTDDDAEELKEESKFDVGGTMCIDDEGEGKKHRFALYSFI